MKRALHLLDELRDVVQRKPWLEIAKIGAVILKDCILKDCRRAATRRLTSPRRSDRHRARCTRILLLRKASSQRSCYHAQHGDVV